MTSDWQEFKHTPLRVILLLFFPSLILVFFFPSPMLQGSETTRSSLKKPTVFFLKGTCSAGKSTLIQAIANEFKDLVIIDEDSIVFESYPIAISKKYPLQFGAISNAVDTHNLYHTLRTHDVFFKSSVTQNEKNHALNAIKKIQDELNKPVNITWKKAVSQSINNEILRRIEDALSQGKNVLLDAWYIKPKEIQSLPSKSQVRNILLYTSLPNAYDRLIKRNKEATATKMLSQKRLTGQLVGSFNTLYEIGDNPKQAIECLDRSELLKTCEVISSSLPSSESSQKPNFTFEELSQKKFQNMFENIFKSRANQNITPLYLQSRDQYDLIINNTRSTPSEALSLFKKFTASMELKNEQRNQAL
jgi:hypothetical protein